MHANTQQRASRQSNQIIKTPYPTIEGSICLLMGIAIAFVLYPSKISEGVTSMASVTSISVITGYSFSILFDLRLGLRNLFRTDILCIFAIYGLTLLEFLFPQEEFSSMTNPVQTSLAINIVLVGMAALTLGRHLVRPMPMKSKWFTLTDLSSKALFQILVISSFLGFLYMLMSVQFNILHMIDAMMGARFTQPWGRGRIGGAISLLTELKLLTYIIPPLTAIAWNRRKNFSLIQLIIINLVCGLTFFDAIAGGSRNIYIAHISTFLMSYLITLRKNTIINTVLPIAAVVLVSGFISYHMLEFRTIGLKTYLEERVYESDKTRDTFAADYNLASIGLIASAIPEKFPYMGIEVITWSIIKPIPRVFLPGKPEGLSISIEEIAGAEGWTIAVTYLGEAYMAFGMLGVIGISLFFGALSAWWNRMVMIGQSDYNLVIYALGFFAAGITMRSMFWFTTAILPVIALVVLRKYGPFR